MGCHVISPLLEVLKQGCCHLPGVGVGCWGQDSCTWKGIWRDGSGAVSLSHTLGFPLSHSQILGFPLSHSQILGFLHFSLGSSGLQATTAFPLCFAALGSTSQSVISLSTQVLGTDTSYSFDQSRSPFYRSVTSRQVS